MLEYEVSVDFHDNAIQAPPQTFTNISDLALYLERIPGMIGLEITGEVTIHVKSTMTDPRNQQLAMSIDA